MLIPVRCFTCNKVIGHLEPQWKKLQSQMSKKKALHQLGLKRDCCRRCMLTYIDKVQMILDYIRANELKHPDDSSSEFITVHMQPLEKRTRTYLAR